MRWSLKQIVPAILAGLLITIWSAHRLDARRDTPVAVTRLYTGPDGQSHFGKIELQMKPSALSAELDESEQLKVSGGQLLRWPPGFVWEGHTASKRQYVIDVGGRAEVEVAGGQKIQLSPGQILLAEDVTGKGHTTRVIGSEDLLLLLVPLTAQ